MNCSIGRSPILVKLQSNSEKAIISVTFNNYLARFSVNSKTKEVLEIIEKDPELSLKYSRYGGIRGSIDKSCYMKSHFFVSYEEKLVTKSGLDVIIHSNISFMLNSDMRFSSFNKDIKYEYVLE